MKAEPLSRAVLLLDPFLPSSVEGCGNAVEVVFEQVSVTVESHRAACSDGCLSET